MRRTAGASARLAWPRMLVAGQSAFCVVLVFGAVLFLRSVNAAFTTSLGFEPRGVVTAIVNANPRMDWTLSRSRTQAILSRIRALPDVRHAAIGTPLLRQGATTARVRVDGRDEQLELDAVAYDFVSPDYFATLRQPRLAGRDFTAADGAGAQPVAIVSDAMAKRFWPGQSAIGHTVSFLPLAGDARVVGIVGDVKSGDLRDDVRCLVYLDIDQNADWLASAVLAQTAGSTADLARNIHAAVRSVDPDVPVYGLETVDDRLEALLMPQRLGLTLIGFLAAVAIGLTAIGVYGVVARLVAQSEKEIGIRIALGAAGSGVVSAIARRNLMPVAAGVAVGAVGAIWSGRYADRFMYGIHANDATAMAASCAGLLAVAAAAAILPARRALRVNPVDVLRAE